MTRQSTFSLVFMLGSIFETPSLLAQTATSKVGGICFRVDDVHPVSECVAYAKIFDRYGYHYTFGFNLGLVDGIDDYFQMIGNLQASGHEFADHTPNHTTFSFTVNDTAEYSGKPGVDHIAQDRVFLQYQPLDPSNPYSGDAIIDINNGFAYSRAPGAFANFVNEGVSLIGIYLPATGQLFGVGDIFASDTSDIDTLQLLSIWGETIPIQNATEVYCRIVGQYDVHMADNAVGVLAQRTLQLSDQHGIHRPYVWIQPGGRWPIMTLAQVKQILGNQYGYTAAASDPPVSLKCYDEYDPNQDKRFGMEWGDFLEDREDLQRVKSIIADQVAKHYFLVGHSHFSDLLGGWDGYLARMDSLLSWCQENSPRIQVLTYSEMVHDLYDVPQNPYINIIPPLNVDLDDNGVPDGYWISSVASLDTTDGVSSDGGYSCRISGRGSICAINGLAGLEKGENDFSIWTKGAPGDTISVTFSMTGYPNQVYKFPAASSNWANYTVQQSLNGNTSLIIPSDVSTASVLVQCTNLKSGVVEISGMCLRKKLPTPLKIVSVPDTVAIAGTRFFIQVETASIYPADTIVYTLSASPSWLQVNTTGVLAGVTPQTTGVFPVTIVSSDQHGDSDSLEFDLYVVESHLKVIQIVSTPDTVVAPNATYYYSVYATGASPSDTLKYSLLTGPQWLTMSADGILSGTAPIVDSNSSHVTILVRDGHADADTQSYSLLVHPILLDDFSYSDSPLNHGWVASLGSGQVSVGFDSIVHTGTLQLSTSSDLDFGVDKYGRWLANTLTASVRSTSDFMLSVWIVDSNSTAFYLQYYSGDGQSTINPDNTISVYLGSQYSNGSWQSLARNLNGDLRSVKWGATVRRILGISIRGAVRVGNLVLGKEVTDSAVNGGLPVISSFELHQNYPNPFNPTTTIKYDIARPSRVTIRIYNVLGQFVRTLSRNSILNKGEYTLIWHGDNGAGQMASSGVYFCRFEAVPTDGSPEYDATKKMLLLK